MKPNTIYIAVIICLAFAWWFKGCGSGKGSVPKSDTIFTSDTIWGDSIPYQVYVPVPKPYKVVVTDTLFKDVDTTAILRDYFAIVYYTDTLKNDTSALVVIVDTVSNNRLKGRSMWFQNRRPTTINNTTITNVYPDNKFQLYGGILLQGNANQFGVGGLLTVKFKNNTQFSGGVLIGNKPIYIVSLQKALWK